MRRKRQTAGRSTRFAAWLLLASLGASGTAFAGPPVPEGAAGGAALQAGDPRVEVRLLVDAAAAQPGKPVRLGVLFELDRGWHIYWRNPGQSGLATELDWQVPGAEIGAIAWPAPAVFREADGFITTYGYSDELLLSSDARFSSAPGTQAEIAVQADFLVCKVQCIPGRVSLSRKLPIETQSRPAERATRALFERWGARVPVSAESVGLQLEALYSQSAIRPDDGFRAGIAAFCGPGATDTHECHGFEPGTDDPAHAFVPDRVESLQLEVTGARPHPFAPGFVITLAGQAGSDDPGAQQRLRGVLHLRNARGALRFVDVDLPLPRAARGVATTALDNPWLVPEPASAMRAGVPLWRALLLALVGGLILNLMPCVLPVLAIKVFGIAERAHADRREVLLHGLAYTLGILATMALLAAVVIGLRAAGTSVGWGFQFQEPLFVAAIGSVLVLFALNLFGVFEISLDASGLSQAGARASGARRSFFEGLLAVIVATPCSAPFLGTAVGFAFASSATVIVAVFLAIGLGLAAPFVAITLVPGWARLLPRSGPWMRQLRIGLGFALLATVVWLLWVIGRSVGPDGMTLLLGFLIVLAIGAWIYGAAQHARSDGRAPALGFGLALLAVGGLAWLPLEPAAAPDAAAAQPADGNGPRAFEPSAIAAELARGHPVFVYFTADWCLTCKLNERVVLDDTRVRQELERQGVVRFKADWTRRDETIRSELARHGRAGVPMYLLYDPSAPARPRLLPELLTVDLLVDALRQAGSRSGDGA